MIFQMYIEKFTAFQMFTKENVNFEETKLCTGITESQWR